MKMMMKAILVFTMGVAAVTAGANAGLRSRAAAQPLSTDPKLYVDLPLTTQMQTDKLLHLLVEDEKKAKAKKDKKEEKEKEEEKEEVEKEEKKEKEEEKKEKKEEKKEKKHKAKKDKKKKKMEEKATLMDIERDEFKAECMVHTTALVRQMDKSYTDLQLKNVLRNECLLNKEFPKVVDTGFDSEKACHEFAETLVDARYEELENGSTKGYKSFCEKFYDEQTEEGRKRTSELQKLEAEIEADFDWAAADFNQDQQQKSYGGRVLGQLIFGLLYYLLVVRKYKANNLVPNDESQALQDMNEVKATLHTSVPNCLLSWCCTGPRAAHTFHSVGVMNYWAGCILMSCFPCCTLWAVNSFTELNPKLGGKKRNPVMGLLSACFCSCCVVAQDAESLDLMTGNRTQLCGVKRAASNRGP